MPVSPENAHARARKGAAIRNSPESYLRSLERARNLTADQKFRVIKLAMSFLDDDERGGAEAGDVA